jgi:hypothetical protein
MTSAQPLHAMSSLPMALTMAIITAPPASTQLQILRK